MPSMRRQKAKTRKSREMMSAFDNLEIKVGNENIKIRIQLREN